MPKKALSMGPDHLYREVLAEAFKLAWRQRKFWILAFFASILLTMGSYDVVLGSAQGIGGQIGYFFQSSGGLMGAALVGLVNPTGGILNVLTIIQILGIAAIILLALGALSCVCQAALVYALGGMRRGDRPGVRESLRVGMSALWPVVALNALALMTLWVLRFLASFALYLVIGFNSPAAWYIYIFAYALFLALSFVAAIVQIFALNAMILQGAPVGKAIVRGYQMFKKHWLITIETALMLLGVAFVLTFAFALLAVLIFVPYSFAVVASAILPTYLVYDLMLGVGFAVFAGGLFCMLAFITQLQYATWTILYRRLGEGGIIAKLHRIYRDMTGTYKIPQG